MQRLTAIGAMLTQFIGQISRDLRSNVAGMGETRMPDIAFVLSGGGSRGDFEVGVLQYLYARDIMPDSIYCTSVGSINGGKLAEGGKIALDELVAIWNSLAGNEGMFLPEPWLDRIPQNARDFIESRPWLLLGALSPFAALLVLGFSALDVTSMILELRRARSLYNLLPIRLRLDDPEIFHKDAIADSDIRLNIAVVSLETGALRFINNLGRFRDDADSPKIDLSDAIQASASIPFVFRPVEINGNWYVDGGVRAVLPIEQAVLDGSR